MSSRLGSWKPEIRAAVGSVLIEHSPASERVCGLVIHDYHRDTRRSTVSLS